MAIRAYILIRLNDPLDEALKASVLAEVYRHEAVECLDPVVGAYDIIALVEDERLADLVRLIEGIDGVRHVQECKLESGIPHPDKTTGHRIARGDE
ncbi:Lrp/AsnC family transcriptional regulator [bacterium]|nr:Lrp/AsnC family transcriptional regulator [candidate division CSSED10-310 bacterium]